jgi:hypothetical protein
MAYRYLSEALLWFGLTFETSKTKYIRIGDIECDQIALVSLENRVS